MRKYKKEREERTLWLVQIYVLTTAMKVIVNYVNFIMLFSFMQDTNVLPFLSM
jgi:hypothetical protein